MEVEDNAQAATLQSNGADDDSDSEPATCSCSGEEQEGGEEDASPPEPEVAGVAAGYARERRKSPPGCLGAPPAPPGVSQLSQANALVVIMYQTREMVQAVLRLSGPRLQAALGRVASKVPDRLSAGRAWVDEELPEAELGPLHTVLKAMEGLVFFDHAAEPTRDGAAALATLRKLAYGEVVPLAALEELGGLLDVGPIGRTKLFRRTCLSLLRRCVGPHNCFAMQRLGRAISCPSLEEAGTLVAIAAFNRAVLRDRAQFLLLDAAPFMLLVSNSNLVVASEMDVWQAIADWVQADVERRRIHLPDLLAAGVRLAELDTLQLAQLQRHPLVAQHALAAALVGSAYSARMLSNVHQSKHAQPQRRPSTSPIPGYYISPPAPERTSPRATPSAYRHPHHTPALPSPPAPVHQAHQPPSPHSFGTSQRRSSSGSGRSVQVHVPSQAAMQQLISGLHTRAAAAKVRLLKPPAAAEAEQQPGPSSSSAAAAPHEGQQHPQRCTSSERQPAPGAAPREPLHASRSASPRAAQPPAPSVPAPAGAPPLAGRRSATPSLDGSLGAHGGAPRAQPAAAGAASASVAKAAGTGAGPSQAHAATATAIVSALAQAAKAGRLPAINTASLPPHVQQALLAHPHVQQALRTAQQQKAAGAPGVVLLGGGPTSSGAVGASGSGGLGANAATPAALGVPLHPDAARRSASGLPPGAGAAPPEGRIPGAGLVGGGKLLATMASAAPRGPPVPMPAPAAAAGPSPATPKLGPQQLLQLVTMLQSVGSSGQQQPVQIQQQLSQLRQLVAKHIAQAGPQASPLLLALQGLLARQPGNGSGSHAPSGQPQPPPLQGQGHPQQQPGSATNAPPSGVAPKHAEAPVAPDRAHLASLSAAPTGAHLPSVPASAGVAPNDLGVVGAAYPVATGKGLGYGSRPLHNAPSGPAGALAACGGAAASNDSGPPEAKRIKLNGW